MNTRSASKKLAEQQAKSSAQEVPPTLPASEEQVSAKGLQRQCDKILLESVGKEEPRSLSAVDPTLSTTFEVSKANSKRSSSSSVLARKKRLELEAAEARAKIELDLINKRLEANLAEIDDERSIPSDHTNKGVEEWLEHSNQELLVQPVHDKGHTSDVPCPPNTQNVGTDGTVHLLASALKDLAAASTNNGLNSNLLSRICTPRELPFFSGDPMEWLHFKQAYEESSKVCNFNDNENLWRLRKCLKGSAREAVSALLISATSPETVMSTLELQFGNPDIILSRIMVDIKKLHPVSQEYYKDIVPFSVKVRNCVAAVKVIGQDEYLNGIGITTCILSKLPPVLLSKWADYSYTFIKQGRKPTWFDISEFLNEEALKVSSMVLLNNKNVANYTQGTVLLNKISDNNEKCKFCRISKHKLQDCKKFRKALRRDRWTFVKRNRICFKCMNSDHDRATCPAAACDVEDCGQPHHKLLHYKIPQALNSDNNTASEPSSPPPPVAPETVTHINHSECKVLLKVVPVTVHGPNGILNTSALLDDGSTVTLISAELASRAGLRGRRETLRVQGAWDDSALVCDADVMSVCIANHIVRPDEEFPEPTLRIMARSTVYNVGETKAIFCKGQHLIEPIQWYSPSGKLVEERSTKNSRVFVERKTEDNGVLVPLIIHRIKISDGGNWTCKAGNLSETKEFIVGEKVNITDRNVTLEGEEGKSVKLTCEANGYPPPVVVWYKDKQQIKDKDEPKKYSIKQDNTLEIKKLNHADVGLYVCKVRQKALSHYTEKTVHLSVQHKPILYNSDTQMIYTNQKYKTEEVYAILNDTKNVTCSAIANPPPTYRWFRRVNGFDDDPITDTDTVITSEDGTNSVLILRIRDESYYGEYRCSANNSKGSESIIFHVNPGSKPQPPDVVNLAVANVTELTFNVNCTSCIFATGDEVSPDPKNLPVIGYIFQLAPVKEGYPADWDGAPEFRVDIEEANNTLFTVGPLTNSTLYHVRVRTRNAAGNSEWMETADAKTTDDAIRLTATLVLVTAAMFVHLYY